MASEVIPVVKGDELDELRDALASGHAEVSLEGTHRKSGMFEVRLRADWNGETMYLTDLGWAKSDDKLCFAVLDRQPEFEVEGAAHIEVPGITRHEDDSKPRTFKELYDALSMNERELSAIINRPATTVKAWLRSGSAPDEIMEAMNVLVDDVKSRSEKEHAGN